LIIKYLMVLYLEVQDVKIPHNSARPRRIGLHLGQGGICTKQYGSDPDTTSNRMELEALLKWLSQPFLTEEAYVVIESDSESCIHMMAGAGEIWKANGWKNLSGSDVKNRPLVEEILARLKFLKVEFRKVAGHAGNEWNEVVDRLAMKGRDKH
jgi:ribonuclease HI